MESKTFLFEKKKAKINLVLVLLKDFEGEAICMDTFDYDESQGERKIMTRVAVGVHLPSSWEITKKTLSESSLGASFNQNLDAAATTSNLTHNSIVQGMQTNSVIARMQYSHLSSRPDFVHPSLVDHIKLASKVLLFEFSYRFLNGISFFFNFNMAILDKKIKSNLIMLKIRPIFMQLASLISKKTPSID